MLSIMAINKEIKVADLVRRNTEFFIVVCLKVCAKLQIKYQIHKLLK